MRATERKTAETKKKSNKTKVTEKQQVLAGNRTKKAENPTEYQRKSKSKQENEYIKIMEEGIRAGPFTTRTTKWNQTEQHKRKV